MNVYNKEFSLDTALKEHGDQALKALKKTMDEQVNAVDIIINKGLTPDEFSKAQKYRAALIAAFSIVALRFNELSKNS